MPRRSNSRRSPRAHTESKRTAAASCGSCRTPCTCDERADAKNLIECETLRGFHASAAGVTPAPSEKENRKMARTPFCSKVLFLVSFRSCVIQSEAKNPGSFCMKVKQKC